MKRKQKIGSVARALLFFFLSSLFCILHYLEYLCWEGSKVTRKAIILSHFYSTWFMFSAIPWQLGEISGFVRSSRISKMLIKSSVVLVKPPHRAAMGAESQLTFPADATGLPAALQVCCICVIWKQAHICVTDVCSSLTFSIRRLGWAEGYRSKESFPSAGVSIPTLELH